MVCSPGRTPTQSQLVHYQRANVAMSRARDKCILVRSLDITDIPSSDDVKIPIIAFFQTSSPGSENGEDGALAPIDELPLKLSKTPILRLMVQRLSEMGYKICSMGIVWKNGICIEHTNSDVRVALMVDDANDFYPDWQAGYRQQQKIERVGWNCRRVDLLSLLYDFAGTIKSVAHFLRDAGIDSLTNVDTDVFHGNRTCASDRDEHSDVARLDVVVNLPDQNSVIDDIITITSEDDDDLIQKEGQDDTDNDAERSFVAAEASSLRNSKRLRSSTANTKRSAYTEADNDTDESLYDFGSDESAVVDLSFLRRGGC
jgi:hypothetical protein